MQAIDRTPDELLARIADLEARLAEAQQTLEAIRKGDVDAIVVGQGARSRSIPCAAPMSPTGSSSST